MHGPIVVSALVSLALRAGVPTPPVPPPREPTEFLSSWDRSYRLIDPEVESSHRARIPDYAAAAAELKKAIVSGIPDGEMYYRVGFCYEKMGDTDRALGAYLLAEKSMAGSPLRFYLWYHLGVLHANKGAFEEAAKNFEKALSVRGDSAPAHNNLGYCYRQLSMRRKAIAEFQRATDLDPRCAEAFLNRGITHAELGELAEAEAALRGAGALNPDLAGCRESLELVRRAGEGTAPETATGPPAEPAPESGGGEEIATATASLKPQRDSDPQHATVERATALVKSGNLAAAGELYTRVLELDPRSVRALLGMAYISEFAGREHYGRGFPAEKSVSFYRRALEIAPEMSGAWFDMGNVYQITGRYREAAESFARAAGIEPSMKSAYYNLALCYRKLGEAGKAEEQFKEAVRRDSDFAEAHFQLGLLCAGRRDYAGAVREYEYVLRLNPSDADTHYLLARIYMVQAEDDRKAAGHFREYLRNRPDAADADTVKEWIKELEE